MCCVALEMWITETQKHVESLQQKEGCQYKVYCSNVWDHMIRCPFYDTKLDDKWIKLKSLRSYV